MTVYRNTGLTPVDLPGTDGRQLFPGHDDEVLAEYDPAFRAQVAAGNVTPLGAAAVPAPVAVPEAAAPATPPAVTGDPLAAGAHDVADEPPPEPLQEVAPGVQLAAADAEVVHRVDVARAVADMSVAALKSYLAEHPADTALVVELEREREHPRSTVLAFAD